MKILAVDFDGTLAPTDFPTIHKQKLIHKLVTAYVKHKRRQGWMITLLTMREDKRGRSDLTNARWFCHTELNLKFDYVNESPPEMIEKWGPSRKIAYDLLIDDKAFGLFSWLLRRFDR